MTWLLVRPKAKLQTSLDAFHQQGISAVGVSPVDIVDVVEEIENLNAYLCAQPQLTSAVVVTSTEAARRLCEQMKKTQSRGQIAFCVGASTAAIISERFEKVIVPELESSEGLITEFKRHRINNCTVILIKGKAGRELISQYMFQNNNTLKTFELYERKQQCDANSVGIIDWPSITGILVTSLNLAEAIFSLYEKQFNLKALPWLVPSERIKLELKQKGCNQITVCHGASDQHLLRSLQELKQDSA